MKETLKRTLKLTFLTLFVTQIGISQSIEQFVTDTIKVDKENVPTDPNQAYFPKIMFPSYGIEFTYEGTKSVLIEGEYDDFSIEWYSEHLYKMKEPLLFNRKTDKEIFRFTWLRTFDKPIAIRIEKSKDDYWLYWKKLSGKGGYEPGELITDRKKRISENEWLSFQNLIKKADFWNMDYGQGVFGNDGSQWILESVNSTDYRVVDRWSPSEGTFYNACDFLISLTNLNIKEKNKY
tara:strand:+ start:53 stop:757 length:705 start_codon:yes stop_codon:yes gene_type:complete